MRTHSEMNFMDRKYLIINLRASPTVFEPTVWLAQLASRIVQHWQAHFVQGFFGLSGIPVVGLNKQGTCDLLTGISADGVAGVTVLLLLSFTEKAKSIGELLVPVAPFDQKSGREAWTVAFAPNGSYIAWSQGHRIVRLIPWTKCLKSL